MPGCGAEDGAWADEKLAATGSGLHCETVPEGSLDVDRSLWVSDDAVLSRFSFARVIAQILSSSGAGAPSAGDLVRRWMDTYNSDTTGVFPGVAHCNDIGTDGPAFRPECPRPEGQLASPSTAVFGSPPLFIPVALVNRFDLAPATGANCGEYRIVYAKNPARATPGGRLFLIFEAVLPNPSPAEGVAGCLPIAEFWADLSSDAEVSSRAAKLEKFYFTGDAIAGVSPGAVVRASNYGLASVANRPGQIRTNNFIDGQVWNLREFKLRVDSNVLSLQAVQNKVNPARQAFNDSPPVGRTEQQLQDFRTGFLAQLTTTRLLAESVTGLAMRSVSGWNTFDSNASSGAMIYRNHAQPEVRTEIRDALISKGSALTPANILDRATTQTCAGCHQNSVGVSLGAGLEWPASLGFVHVDEFKQRSQALNEVFLPHRRSVLEGFINAQCSDQPATPADPEKTVGGSAVGAAN